MSRQSRKFGVPDELANLYDFANTLDVRHFTHHGVPHLQGDELEGPRESRDVDVAAWAVVHEREDQPGDVCHRARIADGSIRDYLQCDPVGAAQEQGCRAGADKALNLFPLVVDAGDDADGAAERHAKMRWQGCRRSWSSFMTAPEMEHWTG